jgi:hypothetical protein
MSGHEQPRRIPTSDELERQGALIPATAERRTERRGGLLKFFRASRFRVSEDVAARKHVGSQHAPPAPTATDTTMPTGSSYAQPGNVSAGEFKPPPATSSRRSPDTIVPRTIRLDPAVKERRGLGRSRPRI